MRDTDRAVLVHAARKLASDAEKARSRLVIDAPARQFYLGVGAAAEELLHPELAHSRPSDWPEREPAPFRDGYLRTTTILAIAAVAPQPPLRIPLPDLPEELAATVPTRARRR